MNKAAAPHRKISVCYEEQCTLPLDCHFISINFPSQRKKKLSIMLNQGG
jgi:hypothetical protein